MASPDYAQRKRKTPPRRNTRGKKDASVPAWVWMLVGLALGLAVAAGIYITRPTSDAPATDAGAPTPAPRDAAGARKTVETPPKKEPRWLFYDLLENYELVVPRDDDAPERKTPRVAPEQGTFLIQVGSFPNAVDAERQKAKLALLGIEAKLQQVTIDNSRTWYRVRVGPESNPSRINTLLAQLDDEGYDSLLIRVKE